MNNVIPSCQYKGNVLWFTFTQWNIFMQHHVNYVDSNTTWTLNADDLHS